MNLFASMGISASGMEVEQDRLKAAAENLALMHVAAKPGGPAVAQHFVRISEKGTVVGEDPTFSQLMAGNDGMHGVAGESLTAPAGTRLQYEPSNPMADRNGMVAYPDINFLNQMVSMLSAQEAFNANVTAYGEARTMLQKSLELGRA